MKKILMEKKLAFSNARIGYFKRENLPPCNSLV